MESEYDGATQEDYEGVINELTSQVGKLQRENSTLSTASVGSNYQKDSNLIALQLDTAELLGKLENFYKGKYIGTDKNGDIAWKEQRDKDLVPLNEYGASLFMEVITKYLDKNTPLSYYNEERIYEILGDIGDELALVVFCNYEKMGMDTYHKKTKFRMLVITSLHVIESAYRRAIEGRTSQDLNQSRIVTQSDTLGKSMPMMPSRKKKFSLIDPRTWGA